MATVTEMKLKGRLYVGAMVNYVLPSDMKNAGEIRPAVVVKVWGMDNGCSQLQVFMDGNGSEFNDGQPNVIWRTSIVFDDTKQMGTWHFPES